GGVPFLRLNLQSTAGRCNAIQDVTWHVTERQATVHAQLRLTAPGEDLALVEWEVPAEIALTEVGGADVRNWSRSGATVPIWLQRSVGQTVVEMAGLLPRAAGRSPAPFHIPHLYLPAASPQTTFVRVSTDEGWELQAQNLHNLWPLPESGSS